MNKLETPIQYVKGVGPHLAKSLSKQGIFTIKDFLFNFPRAYDDRRDLPKISNLALNQVQSFAGLVEYSIEEQIQGKRSLIKCLITDATGSIIALWFNQPYLAKYLQSGTFIYLKGKVEINSYSKEKQISVSEHEFIDKENIASSLGVVVPVYPLSSELTQYKVRSIAKEIFNNWFIEVSDPLPSYLTKNLNLISLKDAITHLHFPSSVQTFKAARNRLVFEDFFYFQLSLMKKRYQRVKISPELNLKTSGPLIESYLKSLPYTLTPDQQKVITEISADVSSSYAMNRLLQGDVGSGKTEVAVMSLLFALESGKKGAIMAPTEILASQHYYKFKKYLEPLGIKVLFLKGQITGWVRKEILTTLNSTDPLIIIGTHALLEDDVIIPNLALVIIDEQHRFGVRQRAKLQKKTQNPHCLYLTATPIPRSLTLTYYGDLLKSLIINPPPGRIPAKTFLKRVADLTEIYKFCHLQLEAGSQIYIVFPLVEESEKLDLKSATEAYESLQKLIFPNYKVGLLHGRMPAKDKEAVMDAFAKNQIQVLVSTTVIEVGIDIPNASVMIIEHAERFGLSQLHQLRGRIGRGKDQSYCFLIGKTKTDNAQKRLSAMVATHNGFKIAEYDLKIRGPGDLLGTRQSGLPDFKIADLIKDEKILIAARGVASEIIKKDLHLDHPEHLGLKIALQQNNKTNYRERLN